MNSDGKDSSLHIIEEESMTEDSLLNQTLLCGGQDEPKTLTNNDSVLKKRNHREYETE